MLMRTQPDWTTIPGQKLLAENVRRPAPSHLDEEPISRLKRLFNIQMGAYHSVPDTPLTIRRNRLERLLQMVESREEQIIKAIDADFRGRSAHETRLAELLVVRGSLLHAKRNLKKWARVRRVSTSLQFFPSSNRLMPQPLGVVGIVAPWNYPLQLSIGPAIAAIAAGNRVLLKPSELTSRFSELLEEAVDATFAPEEMAVVNGDAEVGAAFSQLPFHHLFFTGSTAVGRKVADAAAGNLTPVTLELGGKSPALIDSSANLRTAANRIAFGKLLNAGQTCVAPDYLLVPSGMGEKLAGHLSDAISRMYPTLLANEDYTSIINQAHWDRLHSLVEEARDSGAIVIEVNPAGEVFDLERRKFPPTLILYPKRSLRVMKEEIFGPILPIVEVNSVDEAISYVNAGSRPLALYWFGRNKTVRDRVLRETISGGVTINDCLWHLAQEEQPFGGVGASGMGAYHGEWGFRTFSKEKPVYYPSDLNASWLLYPPYGRIFNSLLAALKKIM